MEIFETIKARRTIHEFETQKVPQDLLQKALEAAIWAPNHNLTMPWAFCEFSSPQKQKIAELALDLKLRKKPELTSNEHFKITELKKWTEIPHIFFILQKRSADLKMEKEDYASIACGIQNASLFLWSLGIGSKWSTGAVTQATEVWTLADISPDEFLSAGFLFIGYARSTLRTVEREIHEVKPGLWIAERKN